MPIPETILTADRDQFFQDWSEPITLRTLEQTYDPETLQTTETHTDTTLQALISTTSAEPTPATAAQHATTDLNATTKSEDLPALAPNPLTQILWNESLWQVISAIESPTTQLTTLHARKIQ